MSSGPQQAEQQQQQRQQYEKHSENEPQGLISISLKVDASPKTGATADPQKEPMNGTSDGVGPDRGSYNVTTPLHGTVENNHNATEEWRQEGSSKGENGHTGQEYHRQYGYSLYGGTGEASVSNQSDRFAAIREEESTVSSSEGYDPSAAFYEQHQRPWGGRDADVEQYSGHHGGEGISSGNGAPHDHLEYGSLFEPFQRAEERKLEAAVGGMVNQDGDFNMNEEAVSAPSERRSYDSWRPSKNKAGQLAPRKISVEKQELIEKRLSMERPCRSLFVRNIGYSTSDDVIREIYSAYGDLQNFHTLLDRRGMAFITFFDLREAERAKAETHGQLVDGRALDVHYSLPKQDFNKSERVRKEHNQGTLRVRLSSTSEGEPQMSDLERFFSPYGDIKYLQHAHEDRTWIIEYFDSRACVRAYNEAHGLRIGAAAISTELEWDADERVPDREEHLAFTSSLRSRSPSSDKRSKDDKSREKAFGHPKSREPEKALEQRRDSDLQRSRFNIGRSRSRSQSRDREREKGRERERGRSPARNRNLDDRPMTTKTFPWENNYRPRENREPRDDLRRPYVTYRGFRPNRQAYELEWPQHILDMQPMPVRKGRDSSTFGDDAPRRPFLQTRDSSPPAVQSPPPPPPPPPMPVPPAAVAPAVPGFTPQQAAALLQGYSPLLANSLIQQQQLQQQLQLEQSQKAQQILSLISEYNRMAAPAAVPAYTTSQAPQSFASPVSQAARSAPPIKDPRLGVATNNNAYSPPEAPLSPVNLFSQTPVAAPSVNLAAGPDAQVQQLMKLLSQAQGQNALGGLTIPGMGSSIQGTAGFGGMSGAMMTPSVSAPDSTSSSGYNPNSAFIDRERAGALHRAPLPSQHDTMLSENLLSDQQRAYLVGREHKGPGGNHHYRQDSSSSSRRDWSPARTSSYDEYGASIGKRLRGNEEDDLGRRGSSSNNHGSGVAKYARADDYVRGGGASSAGGEPYIERDTYGNEQIFTAHGQQRRETGGGGYERQDDRGNYDYADRGDFRRDRGDIRGGPRGRGSRYRH